MITYLRYPSLVNHYAIGKEYRIVEKLDQMWYATEKIHGANAAYYLDRDGNEKFAKRSGFIDLQSGDKQFNQLPECVTQEIRESARAILKESRIGDYIIVYGEYFGSGIQVMDYDVVKNNAKKFLVFDAFVRVSNSASLNYYVVGREELELYFKSENLVPIKDTDTLRNLLKKGVSEKSLLGGYSEGDVFKPHKGYFIDEEHNRYTGVKYKTEKYLEVGRKPVKKMKSSPNLSLEDIEIREELGRYITKNRVNNVISHGEFELISKNIGKIMMAVKLDAINEYKREAAREFSDTTDFNKLINVYSKNIAIFVKEAIEEKCLATLKMLSEL